MFAQKAYLIPTRNQPNRQFEKIFENVSSFYSYYKSKFLGNRNFGGNLRRLAKIIWGGVTQLVFLKNR